MIFSIGGSGSRKETDTETSGSQSEEEARSGIDSSTKTGLGIERAEEELFSSELTQFLDQETLDLLRGLVGGSAGGFARGQADANALSDFAGFLRERAAGTQEFVDERSGAAIDAAQARGEARVQRRGANLAASAGSTFNTLVQQGINRDEIQLDTELAALESNLALQGRNAETAALSEAASVSAVAPRLQSAGLTDIVGLLRGAEVQQTRVGGARRERTQLTLEDIINVLQAGREGFSEFERESKGDTTEFTAGFEFGF